MLYAIVAVIILIFDQAMKYWTTLNIALEAGHKNVIPGFIELTNVHNFGAAFGILQNARWFFVVLIIVFAIIVIAILRLNVVHGKLGRWSLVMVLAGALGNGIDRAIKGYVVDMFHFEFSIFGLDFSKFPVFNIADVFITVGGIIFCLYVVFYKDPLEGFKSVSAKKHADSRAPGKKEARREAPRREVPRRAKPAELPRITPANSENPFAEWLGPRREGEGAARKLHPVQAAAPEPDIQELSTAEDEIIAELSRKDEPKDTRTSSSTPDEFSLEDILDEFRELD